MKVLIHAVIIAAAMTACVWVAFFHPPFWQPTSAKDHLARGGNMAALNFFLALILRGGFRWSVVELGLSLLWCPIIAFLAIGQYSGMTLSENIDGLNQRSLLTMTMFIGIPWMFGVLAGSVLLKCRKQIPDGAA